MLRSWMLSATLLLALPSPPARAQTRRLATAAVSLDAVAADAAWGLLGMRAGARADPRFEVLDLASVGPDRSEWLERARAPLPASLKSFDQMDFAAAQEKADLALAAAANADWTSLATRAAFLDATAARILALHGRNQRAALKSELAGLFAVDPAYQIDSRRCGPELTSASEKVRAAVNRGRVARAELRSLPAGASVWLDGVFRGISPVQVKDLPPGLHFVALRLDGYKPTQVKVLFGTAVPVEVLWSSPMPGPRCGLSSRRSTTPQRWTPSSLPPPSSRHGQTPTRRWCWSPAARATCATWSWCA